MLAQNSLKRDPTNLIHVYRQSQKSSIKKGFQKKKKKKRACFSLM